MDLQGRGEKLTKGAFQEGSSSSLLPQRYPKIWRLEILKLARCRAMSPSIKGFL
jgi:hypothetical protein